MKEPTDRMLIDALCIMAAYQTGRINRTDGFTAQMASKAMDIVGAYAPMAIARIQREKNDQPFMLFGKPLSEATDAEIEEAIEVQKLPKPPDPDAPYKQSALIALIEEQGRRHRERNKQKGTT
jgi:hypothetical protein